MTFKHTILVFVLLFMSYEVFVRMLPWPETTTRSQIKANLLRIERLRFTEDLPPNETVLLGSSLSARLDFSDDHEIANLAMGGLSAREGYEVLLAIDQKPQVVLIELNTLYLNKNEDFTHYLNDWRWQVSSYIQSLRYEHEPMAHLLQLLYKLKSLAFPPNPSEKATNSNIPGKQLEILIQANQNNFIEKLKESDKGLDSFLNAIHELQNEEIVIGFYEMPLPDKVRSDSHYQRFVLHARQKLKAHGAVDLGAFEQTFTYSDGIHLDQQGAHFLKEELNTRLEETFSF